MPQCLGSSRLTRLSKEATEEYSKWTDNARKKTLANKHRQINAPVSRFLQVNKHIQGGNRRAFEMNW